eukprot:TRINITY_DN5524_c0_g1_i1.p1 TRINITY_DN5524_c0_g1~~TRINITY_DN5524_c0_g1_i1.p1  ORF type:complete len:414 (-),score=133.34 TRINITY_DN5524_c0_g1_i1:75-1316(-)
MRDSHILRGSVILDDNQHHHEVLHAGYMLKKGDQGVIKDWKERYFQLLSNGKLTYAVSEDASINGDIDLNVMEAYKANDSILGFMKKRGGAKGWQIDVPGRSYLLACHDEGSLNGWLKAIQDYQEGAHLKEEIQNVEEEEKSDGGNEELLRDIEELKVNVENLEVENKEQFDEIHALKAEIQELKSAKDDLEETNRNDQSQLNIYREEIESLKSLLNEEKSGGEPTEDNHLQKISELKNELTQKEFELAKYQNLKIKLENQLKDAKKMAKTLEDNYEEMKKERNEAKKQLRRTEEKHLSTKPSQPLDQQSLEEITALKEELKEQQVENEILEQKIAALTAIDFKDKLEQMAQENMRLRKENEALNLRLHLQRTKDEERIEQMSVDLNRKSQIVRTISLVSGNKFSSQRTEEKH